MLYRKYRRRIKYKKLKISLVFFIITVIFIIRFFENQVSAFSVDYIQNKAQAVSTDAVCDAVDKVINELDLKYDDLAKLVYSPEGTVQAITTNPSSINKLKSRVVKAAQTETQKIQNAEMFIPLGAFTNLTYLSNLGPDVRLTYCFTGSFTSEIISTFEEAGVNQTIHHIKLLVTSKIITASVDYEGTITFTTDFEIAQTVIVGKVPSFFESNYTKQ